MRKNCLNCNFCKLQLTDDLSDVDFDKPLICINDKAKIAGSNFGTYTVDISDKAVKMTGFKVDDDFVCINFKWDKKRKEDIKMGL